MAKSLFSDCNPPACGYCGSGRPSRDGEKILCPHKGIVEPSFACGRFRYDPLKRVPHRLPALPRFDKEEFTL